MNVSMMQKHTPLNEQQLFQQLKKCNIPLLVQQFPENFSIDLVFGNQSLPGMTNGNPQPATTTLLRDSHDAQNMSQGALLQNDSRAMEQDENAQQ